jgi:hypothetical protein
MPLWSIGEPSGVPAALSLAGGRRPLVAIECVMLGASLNAHFRDVRRNSEFCLGAFQHLLHRDAWCRLEQRRLPVRKSDCRELSPTTSPTA